jgi:hypothetical protein
MASTLALRQAVRGAIMAGSIVSAIEQLRAQCPLVLQGHPVADEVQFHLRCQQYIEFIRCVRWCACACVLCGCSRGTIRFTHIP